MKNYLHGALIFLAIYLFSFSARGAEPNFDTTRPDVLYTNYGTGYYLEGDTPCQDSADNVNANPGRISDYLNAKFSDVNGEGCDFTTVRRSDGYVSQVHHQNWVRREYLCNNGYSGPHGSAGGGLECRRIAGLTVVKPPNCPSCTVGNPIDLTAADKVLKVQDIEPVDSLGFSRTYHSLQRTFSEAQPASLGLAWTSDHSQVLRFLPGDGVFVARAAIIRPDGAPFQFMKSDSSGLWTSERDDLRSSLEEVALPGGSTGYVLTLPDGSYETYDAAGMHLETQLVSGDRLVYEHNTGGRLTKVRNQAGRYLEFAYNTDKRLERVTSSSGQSVEYSYNANRILESTDYGDYLEKYLYTSFSSVHSYLVKVEDGDGNEITSYTYDPWSSGKPASTQRAGGVNRYTADYYTAWQAKIFSTTPLNASAAYSYRTLLGRRVIDRIEKTCAGCIADVTAFAYDANLNIIEEAQGNSKICRSYDQVRNLELVRVDGASVAFNCVTMSGGSFLKKTTTGWDPVLRLPVQREVKDANGVTKSVLAWSYNLRGQVITSTNTDPATSAARTATMTYCESGDITAGTCPRLGLVTSINGPRTDVADTATYTYYSADDAICVSSPTTCPHRKGDLWKVTNALGRITETLAYDGAGRVLSVKDANGVVTDLTYHPRGWLTARKVRGTNNAVETDDQITQIEYWPTGLVKKVTQPDGAFTAYTYDAAHRLTDIADNAGNTIHYTLDNAGNRTAEDTKDSGGNLKRSLSRVYNQLGQLQTAKDAYNHATGFTYDANGNNQLVTDALSRVTDNDYDPLNRLARTLQDVGGIAAETKFEYDALDNLTKVTDPKGLDTTYQSTASGT